MHTIFITVCGILLAAGIAGAGFLYLDAETGYGRTEQVRLASVMSSALEAVEEHRRLTGAAPVSYYEFLQISDGLEFPVPSGTWSYDGPAGGNGNICLRAPNNAETMKLFKGAQGRLSIAHVSGSCGKSAAEAPLGSGSTAAFSVSVRA